MGGLRRCTSFLQAGMSSCLSPTGSLGPERRLHNAGCTHRMPLPPTKHPVPTLLQAPCRRPLTPCPGRAALLAGQSRCRRGLLRTPPAACCCRPGGRVHCWARRASALQRRVGRGGAVSGRQLGRAELQGRLGGAAGLPIGAAAAVGRRHSCAACRGRGCHGERRGRCARAGASAGEAKHLCRSGSKGGEGRHARCSRW